jgi:hypothetical protein
MHLSAKMAQRLGRYFGTGAEYWAGLQTQHDVAVAGRELAWDLRRIERRRGARGIIARPERADVLERFGRVLGFAHELFRVWTEAERAPKAINLALQNG